MTKWQYTKGLHDIGNGLYAYLVLDGSWGWSNAGLVADGGEALLVDTLFDLPDERDARHLATRAGGGASCAREYTCRRSPSATSCSRIADHLRTGLRG
jgi:hypothetical protein